MRTYNFVLEERLLRIVVASGVLDPYEVLGVKPSDTYKMIHVKYIKLVRVNHPDNFMDPKEKEKATDKTKVLNVAMDYFKERQHTLPGFQGATQYPTSQPMTRDFEGNIQYGLFMDIKSEFATVEKAKRYIQNTPKHIQDTWKSVFYMLAYIQHILVRKGEVIHMSEYTSRIIELLPIVSKFLDELEELPEMRELDKMTQALVSLEKMFKNKLDSNPRAYKYASVSDFFRLYEIPY